MKTLRHELKIDTRMPLTFSQVHTIMKNRVDGLKVKYMDLEEFKGEYTQEVFFPQGCNASLVLLTAIIAGATQRHWVVILKHSDRSFSFFDSLALGLHKVSHILKDNRLPMFLRKIRANVNTKRLQSDHRDVATCGLHCICRMLKHDLKNNEYNHWILSIRNLKPDEVVVFLTYIGHITVNK
jgi:hypothetical protein